MYEKFFNLTIENATTLIRVMELTLRCTVILTVIIFHAQVYFFMP